MSEPTRKPRGRPRLPDDDRRSVIIGIRLSPSEYQAKLTANQRFTGKTANGGFESLTFGAGAKVVFSQAASNDSYFFINPKNLKLHVVKGAFRRRGDVVEHINAAMLNLKVFSVLQLGTNNRSRIGVLFT
jgi:hypothetical protein